MREPPRVIGHVRDQVFDEKLAGNLLKKRKLLTHIAVGRKAQIAEVAVFVFLIFPPMVVSFFAARNGTATFDLIAIATILRDLALVCLIMYFLWRNGEPLASIGWTMKSAAREAAVGAVLFPPLMLFAALLENMLLTRGFTAGSKSVLNLLTPSGSAQMALAFFLVVIVAIAEETIFRGYLILRFEGITASPLKAAVLSALLFSVGHGYEGTAGVATVAVMGLALAAVYLWRRSLVAPIVMHFLQDFIAIVAVPLLSHKH